MSLDVYLTQRGGTASPRDGIFIRRNITHNLGKMASEAGIYAALWRPDENNIERAWQLVEPLSAGLAKLEMNPTGFKLLNPKNGWGDYDGLVDFVRSYLAACKEFPDAHVRVSR